MKLATTVLAIATAVAATPSSLPVGVEIFERDGLTSVREVPHQGLGVEKRCNNCVHSGGRCTVGDGNCYGSEHAYCTWCGTHCKSICIPQGEDCTKWCL